MYYLQQWYGIYDVYKIKVIAEEGVGEMMRCSIIIHSSRFHRIDREKDRSVAAAHGLRKRLVYMYICVCIV